MRHAIVAADASNYPWAVCACGAHWSYMDGRFASNFRPDADPEQIFAAVREHIRTTDRTNSK